MFMKLPSGLDVFVFNNVVYVNVDSRGSTVNCPNWAKSNGWKVVCPIKDAVEIELWNRRLDRPRKIQLKKTNIKLTETKRSGKA